MSETQLVHLDRDGEIGAGRSFIAGAGIRQFGKGRPRLKQGERVYDILDAGERPAIVARGLPADLPADLWHIPTRLAVCRMG